jgi:hypothetical protein
MYPRAFHARPDKANELLRNAGSGACGIDEVEEILPLSWSENVCSETVQRTDFNTIHAPLKLQGNN